MEFGIILERAALSITEILSGAVRTYAEKVQLKATRWRCIVQMKKKSYSPRSFVAESSVLSITARATHAGVIGLISFCWKRTRKNRFEESG
ncbi:hypothetical protein EVAR_63640_1 [Eumeta japonica]|uniref:Uncharacterized protein n=1 Tax=Eumeta variegata TaxID=151549 RepID=A0A4C1ZX10_EUMVA|nr:hypothetical protein EVAR_63640_1 [Eumeta japonica]